MRDARIDTQGRYGNVGMRECGNAGMRLRGSKGRRKEHVSSNKSRIIYVQLECNEHLVEE